MKKELKARASVRDKIEADAVVGQMLTCGALIRSNKINQATIENIDKNNIIYRVGYNHIVCPN